MVQAIRVHEAGSADVLTWEHVEVGEPGPGEARIRHTAIGLNFIDTYFRSGLYPAPDGVPFIPGNEGAGIVQTVGEGVSHIKPGDRVAYVGPLGAYAQERIIPADRLVVIPDGIDEKAAAGMMLKGMTAQYLLRQTFNVGPETTLLFHAAAGGVGLIAGQWAAHLGATVIGTAGSQDKSIWPRPTATSMSSTTGRKTSSNGSRKSPTVRAATLYMILWARTPIRDRWIA